MRFRDSSILLSGRMMEEIGEISLRENDLFNQLKEVFSSIRTAGQTEPKNLDLSLQILNSLRHLVYEDMNQLQHEALILKTAKFLQLEYYPGLKIKWLWNPRQTGSREEPDLRGLIKGKVLISGEVTTSLKPEGAIDSRMAKTLQTLSQMPGEKYYVVVSEGMERRANSKVNSSSYQIKVLRL